MRGRKLVKWCFFQLLAVISKVDFQPRIAALLCHFEHHFDILRNYSELYGSYSELLFDRPSPDIAHVDLLRDSSWNRHYGAYALHDALITYVLQSVKSCPFSGPDENATFSTQCRILLTLIQNDLGNAKGMRYCVVATTPTHPGFQVGW